MSLESRVTNLENRVAELERKLSIAELERKLSEVQNSELTRKDGDPFGGYDREKLFPGMRPDILDDEIKLFPGVDSEHTIKESDRQ